MSMDFEMIGTCPPPAPWANNSGSNNHLQTGSVGQLLLVQQQIQDEVVGHHREDRGRSCCCNCWRCWNVTCTWFTSAAGVSIILAVYLILGAVMFIILGNTNGFRTTDNKEADENSRLLTEQTTLTVDRLWAITEDLNILYRDNWTELARNEMRHYQERLVRTLRRQMTEERYSSRQTWTFSMAFLYSVTLVTTIGYGYYTPWTMLSRSLTTAYSLFGVPLFLLYLSVTGERLARLIVRLSGSCSENCQQRRRHRRELAHHLRNNSNAYHSDGAAMLAGTSFGQLNHAAGGGSNGHAVHESVTDVSVVHDEHGSSSSDCCRCCSSTVLIGRRQVPVLICAGLLAILAVTGVFMLSWLDPSLDYDDSLHLLANLLLTLGFAGHLLPGLSAESNTSNSSGSNGGSSGNSSTTTTTTATTTTTSVLLLATATLIILGMTLLSALFNVIVECITCSNSNEVMAVSSDPCVSSHYRPHVTYRHVPSPSQQIA